MFNHSVRRSCQQGFTLLELMVAMTLGGLILGLGIPSFRDYLKGAELTRTANDMLGAFYAARSEAVQRRRNVAVCFTQTPEATTPVCGLAARAGWIVFVDSNSNGLMDAGETLLVRHALPGGQVKMATLPLGNGGYFAYGPNGFGVTLPAGAPLTGIALCDDRGNRAANNADQSTARGLVVSAAGRPRVTRSVLEIASSTIGGCP